MPGVKFSHPNTSVGTLPLRLAPKEVDWSFKLNTITTPTYAGEVVQVLSINFEKLILIGQFGKEGPWGRAQISSRDPELDGTFWPRKQSDRSDYRSSGPYAIGLTQMTEFFRRYFAVASQGRDAKGQGHFDQAPMRVSYEGALDVDVDDGITEGDWKFYPTSFPSFRRSNDNFAPEWRVEGEVAEADTQVQRQSIKAEIERLRRDVGHSFYNPFSTAFPPPTGVELRRAYEKARKDAFESQNERLDHFYNMFPEYTNAEIDELIMSGGSTRWHGGGDR